VPSALPAPILPGQPLTALAPMQDVTDLAFMRVVAHYGAPDYFFTEFFRVHSQSRPEKHILRSIDENTTGRPVFAQLIGEDLHHLARTAEAHGWDGIDGIWVQTGCYTAAAMQLEAGIAEADVKPCAGEASNGHRIQMLPPGTVEGEGPYRSIGYRSISYGSPLYSSSLAFKIAVDMLEGGKHPLTFTDISENQYRSIILAILIQNRGGIMINQQCFSIAGN